MIFSPVVVNVLGLKLNAIDHASVLNMGPSQHVDIFVAYKRNQGLGEQNGDISPIFFPFNYLTDGDWSDSNSVKLSFL